MNRRALAVLLLVAMMAVQCLAGIGGEPEGQLAALGDWTDVSDPEPWTDSFDDMSKVYVPQSGLAGVKVANGEVSLAGASVEGWIATTVITCPTGALFDMVVLDAYEPGESHVEISVLDATKEATEIGYANDTIPGHKDIQGLSKTLRGIDPASFPEIRIQVSLHSSSGDLPILRAIRVYYSPADEWRLDFVSMDRIDTLRGLNMTDGVLTLDLTERTGSVGTMSTGKAFPTVVMERYSMSGTENLNVFRANFDQTGYGDMETMAGQGTRCLALDDLNGDGNQDLVLANAYYNSESPDSQIYWGKADGTWDTSDPSELDVTRAHTVATGDFNGDGHRDIALGCYHSSLSASSAIFLNNGDGTFDHTPDIIFTDEEYTYCAAGDLNNDGYDDIVFAYNHDIYCYNGGPSGPDRTPDIHWYYSVGFVYRVFIDDLDGDGNLDLIISIDEGNDKMPVFMGSESGLDAIADYRLGVGENSIPFTTTAGDINGDGYMEVFLSTREGFQDKVYIYEGSSSGYDGSSPHKFNVGGYIYAMGVADINVDGYGDLVLAYNDNFRVYYGGESLPTDPDITKTGPYYPWSLVIATGGGSPTRKFAGRLTTQQIVRPANMDWDTLVLEGSIARNTSFRLTVQDSTGQAIDGFEDLTSFDVDLSGIPSTVIKVDLWLESDLNSSTPVFDRLRVKWQEVDTWRDQFWGDAKVHRMMGTTVSGGRLRVDVTPSTAPDLLVAGMMAEDGSTTRSLALAGTDDLRYATGSVFDVRAASAVDTGDLNGDGYLDIIFASYMSGPNSYTSSSPLYMGSPVGWRSVPDHTFATTGASDVLLEDLDGDGFLDVVFAQERDSETFEVESRLFWGSAEGWADEPDVEFATTGASGVVAADLDGDGDLDLAFSCYKDASTATDSLVFLQQEDGFHGGSPDHDLATMGARAVATGDLDGDGNADMVFANSFSSGFAEIDSYVYWGLSSGGFGATPTGIPTSGAEDVVAADLDGDGDLDLAFANHMDNNQNNSVDSYVYINRGGVFATSPDARLPTLGASAVTAVDLDGSGMMDLVFTCLRYGEDVTVPSLVYLGGTGGWQTTPDIELPTVGASDVVAGNVIRRDTAGYLSQRITPSDIGETGDFHTLRYTAHIEGDCQGAIALVDADTWDTLASTTLQEGTQGWVVEGLFTFRDHPNVRVAVTATGLDLGAGLWVDDINLNWTKRVHLPPSVIGMSAEETAVYRMSSTELAVVVSDEHTPPDELVLTVQHRIVGTEEWSREMIGAKTWRDGAWRVQFTTKAHSQPGLYEFRVDVTDTDQLWSGPWESDLTIEVRNIVPTSPEVQISPGRAITTVTLRVEIIQSAQDPENHPLTYRYQWFRDGQPVEELVSDSVLSIHTSRGENWSIEVRAFDGVDEGPAAIAWRTIENAAPLATDPLPDPMMDEDTEDSDLVCLLNAFTDPDGDTVTWRVDPPPVHITVTIDHVTGLVTFRPDKDWNGQEEVTFVASDGELQCSRSVTVMVNPVNDAPRIVGVNGEPVNGGPLVFNIDQGEMLVIRPSVVDVEGHGLVFDVNTTSVVIDPVTGEISFEPDNGAVGTLRFALSVWDTVSPTVKVKVDIVIHVENQNDPMDPARITNPEDGAKYKVNQTFFLTGVCSDPDAPYGQVLNFTWTSSLSGLLGYGSSLTLSIGQPGLHTITLTVSDGQFQVTDTITVEVVPRDDGDPGTDPGTDPGDDPADGATAGIGTGLMVAMLVLVIAGAGGGYVLVARRNRTDADDPEDEVMDEREALSRIADMAREAADAIEGTKNGNGEAPGDADTWVETGEMDGIQVASASVAETQITMHAHVTEEAPSEIEALFDDIERNGFHASEEDAEQLRSENLKRKYQNAIGRLPYGIPSKEIADRDWVDLAAALATGEKRTVEGGREVTLVDGRWYYSDHEDMGTFLKEHGAKKEARPSRKAASHDNTELLAKLEERFIMGEISEESYVELKDKLQGA